jgi:hypothetical protein
LRKRPSIGPASWLAAGAILAPAVSHASAWPAPYEGVEIISVAQGEQAGSAVSEADQYSEQPLAGRYDLILQSHGQTYDIYSEPDSSGVSQSSQGWSAEAQVAVKANLLQTAHTAIAAQAGFNWQSSLDEVCDEIGAEVRLLGGVSSGKIFAGAEAAYRLRSGGCRAGKLDLTLGWKPTERWMGLAQTFVDDDAARQSVIKLQFSLIRYTDEGAGLQLGLRVRADEAGDDERALVVGWWQAPHKSVTP